MVDSLALIRSGLDTDTSLVLIMGQDAFTGLPELAPVAVTD
jgi:nicotinic acid mononucleotide adenylyltransferase